MRIDLLISDNEYGVVRSFAKSFQKAFLRQKIELRAFEMNKTSAAQTLMELAHDPADWTLSFDLRIADSPLVHMLKGRYLTLLVDPFPYHADLLNIERSHISVCDEKEFSFLKKQGFERVFFLPHGVAREWIEKPEEPKKRFDLLFLGSFIDCEKEKASWKERFGKKQSDLLIEISKNVLEDPFLSLHDALILECDEKSFNDLYIAAETFIRAKERIELLKQLSGFDLHIFGRGPWAASLPKAKVYPAVSFEKAISLMQETLFVVNASCRFKKGLHERILYALARFALPITSSNESGFCDEDLLFYRFGKWDEMKEQLADLLANENERKSRVKRSRSVLKDHSFDERAKSIMRYLQTYTNGSH